MVGCLVWSGSSMDAVSFPVSLPLSIPSLSSDRSSASASSLRGKLYPNGEFTVGRSFPRQNDRAIHALEVELSKYVISGSVGWVRDDAGRISYSVGDYVRYADDPRVLDLLEEIQSLSCLSDDPLTLTDVANSHNDDRSSRQPRGSKGISSYGRRSIKQGVWCLEELYGQACLGFLTVTLPPFCDHDDVFAFLLADFSELRRRLCQEIEREMERKGFRFDYVCAVEIQEGRFERFGEPAPHLHFCYRCRDKPRSAFYLNADELRAIWRGVLVGRVSGVFGACPAFFSNRAVNCQVIKKSASRYMAKYLSKGGKVLERMKSMGLSSFIPSSWYGLPLRLKKYIASLTVPLPLEFCQPLFLGVDFVASGVATYVRPIVRDGFVFGFYGVLALSSLVSLEDFLSCV